MVPIIGLRPADRLFADDDEPSGWYVVIERLPS